MVEQNKLENQEPGKYHLDDIVMYKNILGEWQEGVVIKVNNTTIRILNKDQFKILSLKYENVVPIEEYNVLKDSLNKKE